MRETAPFIDPFFLKKSPLLFPLSTYHAISTMDKTERARVAPSAWDMLASYVSTMVRLSREAIVVHVA